MSYILHISSWFPHEGDPQNGVFIRQHIDLLDSKHKSVLIVNTPISQKHLIKNDYDVYNLNEKHGQWRKFRHSIKVINSIKKKHGAPIAIHLHVIQPLFLVALLAKTLLGGRLIVTEHWTGYRNGNFSQMHWLRQMMSRITANSAFKVLAVSESLKQDLVLNGVGFDGKIKVVPNPIILNPSKNSIELISTTETINMLSVADFNEVNKNYLGILSAFETIADQLPKLHWHIIGDGPDFEDFQQRLNQSEFSNRVHLHGRKSQAEVHSCFSQFQFLVNFSRHETFAMVPAEAIKSGIPAIATSCGGPEHYVNSENGILIESENEQQLIDAITHLYTHHTTYTPQIVSNSLPLEFSKDYFIDTISKIYSPA